MDPCAVRRRAPGPRSGTRSMTNSKPESQPFWKLKAFEEMTTGGVGEPVRRLRALLPRQARGRRHRRHSLYRRRLHVARRQDLPLSRLSSPKQSGSRLRPADALRRSHALLAAGHLRLSTCLGRQGPTELASARLRFGGQRPRRRRLHPRAGLCLRGRPWARSVAGSDCPVAEPPAKASKASRRVKCLARQSFRRGQ